MAACGWKVVGWLRAACFGKIAAVIERSIDLPMAKAPNLSVFWGFSCLLSPRQGSDAVHSCDMGRAQRHWVLGIP